MEWMARTNLCPDVTDGAKVAIRGRVLDADGNPVPDALIEVWQADASGQFASADFLGQSRDSSIFLGFGRIPTDENGEFQFTTIKPGTFQGANGETHAPHLAITIFMRGLLRHLVSRIYFPDDPANEQDLVLKLVPHERRATLIARPLDGDATTLEWNVRLQGEQETVFFEC